MNIFSKYALVTLLVASSTIFAVGPKETGLQSDPKIRVARQIVNFFDFENKRNPCQTIVKRFYGQDIDYIRIPSLQQSRSVLGDLYTSGSKGLCGYYALFAAITMSEHPQASIGELKRLLSDRAAFETRVLNPCRERVLRDRTERLEQLSGNDEKLDIKQIDRELKPLSGRGKKLTLDQIQRKEKLQEISGILDCSDGSWLLGIEIIRIIQELFGELNNNILVPNGYVGYVGVGPDDNFVGNYVTHTTDCYDNFKLGLINHLVLVVTEFGTNHWYAAMFRRNANDNNRIQVIITDSLCAGDEPFILDNEYDNNGKIKTYGDYIQLDGICNYLIPQQAVRPAGGVINNDTAPNSNSSDIDDDQLEESLDDDDDFSDQDNEAYEIVRREYQDALACIRITTREYDEKNRNEKIKFYKHSENIRIFQIPFLQQWLKGMDQLPEYGADANHLCGYYAMFSAMMFNLWSTASPKLLKNMLSRRDFFEEMVLTPLTDLIGKSNRPRGRWGVANLATGEIEENLPAWCRGNIIVCYSSKQRPIYYETIKKNTDLINDFRTGARKHLVFIVHYNNPGHWYTVMLRRNEKNENEMLIANSIDGLQYKRAEHAFLYSCFDPDKKEVVAKRKAGRKKKK